MFHSWQFYIFVSLLSGVTFFQFYKLAVSSAKHDGAATILIQIVAGLTAILLIPSVTFKLPSEAIYWWIILAACIFYAISDRLATTVRKHLEVSVYSVLAQLTSIFIIIYGILLYHDAVVLMKLAGAGCIIAGNIFLQYKKGKIELNKYVLLSIIGSFALATGISIDIGASKQFNLPFYNAITFLVPALFILISERIPLKILTNELKHLNKKYILVTGIAWEFTILFLLRAYQTGSITTVVSFNATGVLLNVLAAYLFLHEKSDIFKKVIAAGLVIIGIILTVI